MHKLASAGMMVVLVSLAGMVGCGPSSEECNVTISYVLEPSQGMPEGLKSVAVLDAGVEVAEGDPDAERSKKWAKIAADTIEGLLNEAAREHGVDLAVQNRRQTQQVMQEKDLKMAGLVSGGEAAQAAQLLEVQAIITTQLNMSVEKHEGTKTTFDITNIYAGGWGGGGSITPREAKSISRNLTVQCKFNMIDAANGQAVIEYAPKPFRKTDTEEPSPIYGSDKTEADLDPMDKYIGELVEKGVREFVSTFVPCTVEYTYDLESGSGEGSVDGILALRAEDYERAVARFKTATQDDPKDHESCFAMGVAYEKMGNYDEAEASYKRAVSLPGLDDEEVALYKGAMERVQTHKARIRKA
jgi:tetratricopeptide (TPR) repeat protein